MSIPSDYQQDIDFIIAQRNRNGSDYWTGDGGKVYVGSPFSTIGSLCILHELDVDSNHECIQGAINAIMNVWQDDGVIRVGPKSPMYPCYMAEASRAVSRFGFANDDRILKIVEYFLNSSHHTGGWRCNFTKFGKGPETAFANPGATLFVLDSLRFQSDLCKPKGADKKTIDAAVESLLDHWTTRKPIGPCHYGIGTTFLKLEYPFVRYNIFYYVYVLSFFSKAKKDKRFKEALKVIQSNLDNEGRVVVESPHRNLSKLNFCRKGKPSDAATKRYQEIIENMEECKLSE